MKLADAVDPPEEKPIDPHVALEKLIRLDRKHTNFDYVDSSRKYLPFFELSPNSFSLFYHSVSILKFNTPVFLMTPLQMTISFVNSGAMLTTTTSEACKSLR